MGILFISINFDCISSHFLVSFTIYALNASLPYTSCISCGVLICMISADDDGFIADDGVCFIFD